MKNNKDLKNSSASLTTGGFALPATIAIVAFLVLAGIVYFNTRTQTKTSEQPTADQNTMKSQEATGDKTKNEKMMGAGIVLKNGTIMLEEGDKMSPLAKEYVFETGVKVSLTGKVTKKDGTTVQLKEGESVWEDGSIVGAGANEMMPKESATMMKKEGGAMMAKYTGIVLAGKSAPLLDFTKADYDMAVKSDKLVVLYFYANWCPICKAEFPVMQKVFNELSTDKAIGFRVNYNDDQTDTDEKALAKQFGVAYQHTKVFVKNGQRILKSPEGWDEKRYDTEINKALTQ